MATDESTQYDMSNQSLIWSWPRMGGKATIILNARKLFLNEADEAVMVDNLMSRRATTIRRAATYRQQLEAREYTITVKQAVIDHLEAEVQGLERAKALHQDIINKQAARIKALEQDNAQQYAELNGQAELIKSYETQLIALTAADSELTPAYSATDNLG